MHGDGEKKGTGKTKSKWLTKLFFHFVYLFGYKTLKLFGFFLLSFKREKETNHGDVVPFCEWKNPVSVEIQQHSRAKKKCVTLLCSLG